VRDVAEFRERAEECRQLAETSCSSEDQALWLRRARDWLSLAATAENEKRRAGQASKNSN
jgi:hypothetical protein